MSNGAMKKSITSQITNKMASSLYPSFLFIRHLLSTCKHDQKFYRSDRFFMLKANTGLVCLFAICTI